MKKRLFLYATVIILAGLLCFFAASVYITHNNNLNIAKDTVIETAQIYSDLYNETADYNLLVKAGKDARVTIISSDGKVLADSQPLDIEAMENHLNRPEIQDALDGVQTTCVRYSSSLGTDLIYYAVKADTDNGYIFIRISIPVAKIDSYLINSLLPLVLILCAVVLLCFAFSHAVIWRITKPFEIVGQKMRMLSVGEYTPEPIADSYEEVDALIKDIGEVAQTLQNNMTALRDEKIKAEYILNNIGDGIFAVDESKTIAFINNAAVRIFDVTQAIAGKDLNYLTYEKSLAAAVDDCINQDKTSLFEMTSGGKILLVTVKRLPDTMLTMVILSDITDSRKNTKQREEFFANASHELKTPLTAIKGFNELVAINNKDEGVNKYIGSITRETDRMLALIGDMLKLSELENADRINPVSVSLVRVAIEVRNTLSSVIAEKNLSLDIVGDGIIETEPEHIYELIKNLIENAVRYNNQGGRVSVIIENDKKVAQLFVYDDGIGISPKEQERIFERFYRVEKSRSQKNGGTGLGLSIVKHICALYGWQLSLKSKLGVGTEIKVTFGKGK